MLTVNERIIICEQASAEWFNARMGCVTSSRVADAIHKLKRVKDTERKLKESMTRQNMRYELMCERLSGKATENYVSRWMKEGKEKEPLARAEYEIRFGVTVEQVGFVYHPTIKWAGASPDGLVGNDGMLEIKCPKIETHLQYLVDDVIPEEYEPQMRWQLACEDTRVWNDFCSYCPDVPDEYQFFKKRMDRTKECQQIIAGMELEVEQCIREVEEMLAKLRNRA